MAGGHDTDAGGGASTGATALDASGVDRPDVVAEVRAAFEAYERALVANDVAELDQWFWDDPRVVRYGIAEQQYGSDAIRAWRGTTDPVPADRRIERVVVLAVGDDSAVVSCEFTDGDRRRVGRQTQTWARVGDRAAGAASWRVVAAHVSVIG
jgi:hypothetical protein